MFPIEHTVLPNLRDIYMYETRNILPLWDLNVLALAHWHTRCYSYKPKMCDKNANMSSTSNILTHWGRVTHICVSELTIIGAWSAPSHCLNQCWNIVNWIPRNKIQWNVSRNSYIFIQENPFENVIWKMATTLSRTQCVNRRVLQLTVLWTITHIFRGSH